MRALPIVAGAAGLCLAAWLLRTYGLGQVLALLRGVGWLGMAGVIGIHLVQMTASAAGWRSIAASAGRRPGLAAFGAVRLVREGVNNLLPVAQIGGPVVGARLLQGGGMALPQAIAITVADLTLEMVTQILFTLLGLALLLLTVGDGGILGYVVTGLAAACCLAAAFVGAQWFGLGRALEAGMLRLGGVLGWTGSGQVAGLHRALVACYARPGPVLLGSAWHMLSWLLGGAEVCLALHLLGHDVGFGTGLVVESLGQAAKAAGFAVPAAVGVQEGGYIVICGLFNLPPEVAIALSLVKRLREITLGLPGLALWHRMERRMKQSPTRVAEESLS